jgi:hypothetical protein
MGIREDTGNTLNRDCLAYLERIKVTAWRSNNVPVYDPKLGCYRKFLGRKGVSDIVGVFPQEAKLWDGRTMIFGLLLCVETKAPGDRLSKDQKSFADAVLKAGGIYICARKVGDLVDALAAVANQCRPARKRRKDS